MSKTLALQLEVNRNFFILLLFRISLFRETFHETFRGIFRERYVKQAKEIAK
jgi:hypothetical protein